MYELGCMYELGYVLIQTGHVQIRTNIRIIIRPIVLAAGS